MFSCPQDNFHNLIDHIPIDHEPKAKAQDCIIDFDRVIGGYISIWDSCDGVNSPVNCVEVL